ncbi:glycosyltransferase [Hyphococcus sp.]|uniref:glycosyltransferase n=1 Tax=Hyphococcus sp. TaxID=2038636 RepID=UPI00208BC297|nr:MAG: glycosyl transferase [Marinicaulis sp.]
MQPTLSNKRVVLTQHMFGLGGIDRVGCLLANGFAAADFDVDLLVFCQGGPAEEMLLQLIDKRVRVTYFGRRTNSRAHDLIRLTPKWVSWLRENTPDVVISTCNNMNWISAAGVMLSGCKKTSLVLKTTNPILREKDRGLPGSFRRLWYRKAFEYADKVLALSDAETKLLRQQFPSAASHIETVVNPYVTSEMLTVTRVAETDRSHRIILGVGRFEPQKRMDLLLRSFARLDNKSARLVILGDGPERSACEALARELGVIDRVSMPGFVTDVAAWLNTADVFVLTSVYEGLPAVVFEAMACNCPVLSTDCFLAARELLSNAEHCAIIERAAPEPIAQLIADSLHHERPTTLRAIAQNYTIENGVQSHVDHVRALISTAA